MTVAADGETTNKFNVTGTLKHITGWTDFSNIPAEQEGYYAPVKLTFPSDFTDEGRVVKVSLTGNREGKIVPVSDFDDDGKALILVRHITAATKDDPTTFALYPSAEDAKNGTEQIAAYTFNFSGVTLESTSSPTATPTEEPTQPTPTPTTTVKPSDPTPTPTTTVKPSDPTPTPTATPTVKPSDPTPTPTVKPSDPTPTPTATAMPERKIVGFTSISAYKDEHGNVLGNVHFGEHEKTPDGIAALYADKNSHDGQNACDAKVAFVTIDMGAVADAADSDVKYTLVLSQGKDTQYSNGQRLNPMKISTAKVMPDSTVCDDMTPWQNNDGTFGTLTWNNRPQMGELKTQKESFKISNPRGAVAYLDITDYVKTKTGNVVIAIAGEQTGKGSSEIEYEKAEIKITHGNEPVEPTPKPQPTLTPLEENQGRTWYTPVQIASIGGWTNEPNTYSGDHGNTFDELQIGGQDNDALSGYKDTESQNGGNWNGGTSHDIKVGFARFDLGNNTDRDGVKYELEISNARAAGNVDRLNDMKLYAALVDPNTTLCTGKTAIGTNWRPADEVNWNNRPQLLAEPNMDKAVTISLSDIENAKAILDVTDLLKDKNGMVTIAVFAERAGDDAAEAIFSDVYLSKIVTKDSEDEELPEKDVMPDKAQRMHFDMNSRSNLAHSATGFLYGQAEINVPTIDLLYGLKPDTMVQKAMGGLQHPTGDAMRTSSSVRASGVKDMQVYLQDAYLEWPYNAPIKDGKVDIDEYQKCCEATLYKMICDDAKQEDDGAFLGSDGKYHKLNSERAKDYSYVLFNEPNEIWFGVNHNAGDPFNSAWEQIYNAVHKIDPNARCVGPNYAYYNSWAIADVFLNYCKEHNCLPEIVSWHEISDASSYRWLYRNYNEMKDKVASIYAGTGRELPELLINEYTLFYDIGATGGLVKWLGTLEDADAKGCMAYWGMANSLNEMVAEQNSPASSWWVYHWYAQMTGKQCDVTTPDVRRANISGMYGVTSYDEDNNIAYSLFGGGANYDTETVYLDNIDKTNLVNENGAVNVKVYGVSHSGQQGTSYKPEVVFDGAVTVDNNTLTINIEDTDELDAYFAVITKATDDAESEEMSGAKFKTVKVEAEDATLGGSAYVAERFDGHLMPPSGRKDVGDMHKTGASVEFTVTVDDASTYDLGVFYSLAAPNVDPYTLEPKADGQNRAQGRTLPIEMKIDNGTPITLGLESTVSDAYRSHINTDVELTEGEHKITFIQKDGDTTLNAFLDKIELTRVTSNRYDFELDMKEMQGFKTADGYRVTAVAPKAGYYTITGATGIKKQIVDYAKDAKSYSECAVYDTAVENTVYLAQGANTLLIPLGSGKVTFSYDAAKTKAESTVVNAEDMTIHGNSPKYVESEYANSGKVIADLGIGQNPAAGAKAKNNYVDFTITTTSEGMYNFAIRYRNNEPAPVMQKDNGDPYIHPYNVDVVERYAQIKVNGEEPETVYFRNTASKDTFKTVDVQLKLNEGENTIRIYNDNSYQISPLVNSTAPEIDTITVSKLSYAENSKVTAGDVTGPIEDEILSVDVDEHTSTVNYSVDFDEECDMFVALYNEDGVVVAVKKDLKDGSFELPAKGKYKIKAFFWKDMEPIHDYEQEDIEF